MMPDLRAIMLADAKAALNDAGHDASRIESFGSFEGGPTVAEAEAGFVAKPLCEVA